MLGVAIVTTLENFVGGSGDEGLSGRTLEPGDPLGDRCSRPSESRGGWQGHCHWVEDWDKEEEVGRTDRPGGCPSAASVGKEVRPLAGEQTDGEVRGNTVTWKEPEHQCFCYLYYCCLFFERQIMSVLSF